MMSDADAIIELGDQLAAMCESLDDLKQQLVAEREARQRAEAEVVGIRKALETERQTSNLLFRENAELNRKLAKRQAVPEGIGDAINAMNEAKLLPVWDSLNNELHKRIDVIFRFISAFPQPARKD